MLHRTVYAGKQLSVERKEGMLHRPRLPGLTLCVAGDFFYFGIGKQGNIETHRSFSLPFKHEKWSDPMHAPIVFQPPKFSTKIRPQSPPQMRPPCPHTRPLRL